MKISNITLFTYNANYSFGTYTMSGGRTSSGQKSLVVRLRTDDGFEGWAESAPLGTDYLPSFFEGEVAALKLLAQQVLGLDPRSPSSISENMERNFMSGTAAKSVIEMACWDILGKATGLPTSALLGGPPIPQEGVRSFAVIGLSDPETGVKKARAEFEKGVKAMQLKVGDDPVNDARRVKAIRQDLPDTIDLWADANAGWNLEQALVFVRALGQDITVALEQPCPTLAECIEVGRRTGVPIVIDEALKTFNDLVTAYNGGVSGVNIKLSRVGGFSKARTLRDAAVALNMKIVVDDTWGCALTQAQNLQFAASTPRNHLRAVDLFAEWTNPMIADAPRLQSNGEVYATPQPGNGFGAVNTEFLGEPLFEISV